MTRLTVPGTQAKKLQQEMLIDKSYYFKIQDLTLASLWYIHHNWNVENDVDDGLAFEQQGQLPDDQFVRQFNSQWEPRCESDHFDDDDEYDGGENYNIIIMMISVPDSWTLSERVASLWKWSLWYYYYHNDNEKETQFNSQ